MDRYKKVRESVKADVAPAELSEDLQHVLQVLPFTSHYHPQ